MASLERKPNLSSLPTSKTQAYYDPNHSLLGPVEVRILPAHCRIPGTLAVSMIVTHLGMRRVWETCEELAPTVQPATSPRQNSHPPNKTGPHINNDFHINQKTNRGEHINNIFFTSVFAFKKSNKETSDKVSTTKNRLVLFGTEHANHPLLAKVSWVR